jgi:aspartyl protease family protein
VLCGALSGRGLRSVLLVISLGLLSALASAASNIEVEGLMPPGAAVVRVDGQRKLLKVGQTFQGVTLVSVYTRTATLEVDGRESVVGLSRKVGTNYQAVSEKRVTIQRNQALQYRTAARINGRKAQVMVDTGANIVALNSAEARRLGVSLDNARRGNVETAAGNTMAWQVNLDSVDVGGIRVNNVPATVLDGAFPSTILLGMTYLRHVKIEENQGIMTLVGGP